MSMLKLNNLIIAYLVLVVSSQRMMMITLSLLEMNLHSILSYEQSISPENQSSKSSQALCISDDCSLF